MQTPSTRSKLRCSLDTASNIVPARSDATSSMKLVNDFGGPERGRRRRKNEDKPYSDSADSIRNNDNRAPPIDGSQKKCWKPPTALSTSVGCRRLSVVDVADLSIYSSPIIVTRSCIAYIAYKFYAFAQLLHRNVCSVVALAAVVIAVTLGSILGAESQPLIKSFWLLARWCFYWLGLGILSSVGLGTGLHTFLLFLGPYIANVSTAASSCRNIAFQTRNWSKISCLPSPPVVQNVTMFEIYELVALEAFCWGLGTAIGELPPYFLAKTAAESGKITEDLRHVNDLMNHEATDVQSPAQAVKTRRPKQAVPRLTGNPLILRGKAIAMRMIHRFGFLGILVFASVPNPLFDLAGIMCGSCGVQFFTFFSATLLGKAVIKATIQSVFVIALFSRTREILGLLDQVAPTLHAPVAQFFESEAKKYLGDSDNNSAVSDKSDSSTSLISLVWNGLIAVMMLFFLLSIIEGMAKRHLAKKLH